MKNKIKAKLQKIDNILMFLVYFQIFSTIISLPIFLSYYLDSIEIGILVHFLMYIPFFITIEKCNKINDKLNKLKSKKQRLEEKKRKEEMKEMEEHSKKRQNELLNEIAEDVAPIALGVLIGSFFF